MTNNGSIFAWRTGLVVVDVRTFTGDISNSGTISSTLSAGIFIGGTSLATGVRTFNGDIINSGKIVGGASGIAVADIGTFTGNIINTVGGTISASGAGISVSDSRTFIGNLSNGGIITAGTGIVVGCSCGITNFTGDIVNSGMINATRTGVVVDNVSTFAGAITNTGTVSGATGILISGTSNVSFFDSGTIIGTGGTGI